MELKTNSGSSNCLFTTHMELYKHPHTVTTTDITPNMRQTHTSIVSMYLATRGTNKILHTPPPPQERVMGVDRQHQEEDITFNMYVLNIYMYTQTKLGDNVTLY